MSKLLEVIVTSVQEAKEAEAGGADRLELVRSLDEGGLTPEFAVVAEVVSSVLIPVRVMLRENAYMSIADEAELARLRTRAREFGELAIDGFVVGFVNHGSLDCDSMHTILQNAPHHCATFHRAFEYVNDPFRAIEELKQMGQIDRILTNGGEGSWQERTQKLRRWQAAAAPEIRILAGAGLSGCAMEELKRAHEISEIHVGRAARLPQTYAGMVSREQIALLKSALR